MAEALQVEWLGTVPYGAALERQRALVDERRAGRGADRLLLLEHPPVVTLGRSARPENLRTPAAELARRGVEVHEVARGGDVTWHGPGQLVGYAIVDLEARGARDVHAWLRLLEGGLIEALAALGVAAEPRDGMTGVFAAASQPPRKLASIGVGLRGWVTYHGFALNATTAADAFDDIVPCGLHGVEMGSVARELRRAPEPALFDRVREAVAVAFRERLA